MLVRKLYLVVSDPNSNLLSVLSEFEYQRDAIIDIILTDICTEEYLIKLINCFAYLLQINYSYHKFRIFTFDKNLVEYAKMNKEILGLKENLEIHKSIELLNSDLVTKHGNLININKYYNYLIYVKNDKIEVYTDIVNSNIEVKINGNGSI